MSFNRVGASSKVHLSGSRSSVKSGQILVSSGCPSLDALFNGGIPLGSIFLVGQDEYDCYSSYLVKYFLSEGVVHAHKLFLATADPSPATILQELPTPVPESESETRKTTKHLDTNNEDDMKIAFRYKELPTVNPSVTRPNSAQLGRDFDLKSVYPTTEIDKLAPITFCPLDNADSQMCGYDDLLRRLHQVLKEEQKRENNAQRVLRIAIQGIGSHVWGSQQSLAGFLAKLRLIVRDTYTTDSVRNRVICNCDLGIELESAPSSPVKNEYGLHHGILRILQLPHRHCVSYQSPACLDLGFKLKRKQFAIERLHLPPALEDSGSNQSSPGLSCSSGLQKNKLDF